VADPRAVKPWPTELRLKREERRLEVDFDDGVAFSIPAELLRVESPSAEVRGHGASEKKIVPGKRKVAIASLEPQGHYAIRILFDDGHDTGIFTWDYLYELGLDQDHIFETYLKALESRGLSRDP
jgi:DUF971 family protein